MKEKNVALLYSFEQKYFHIETLKEYILSNVKATINKKDHQYRLVALAYSYDEAVFIIEDFKKAYPDIFIERSSNLSL